MKRVGEVDQPVTRVEIEGGVHAGIMWRSIGEGMVPIFEEHSARIERGLTVAEWYALDSIERAMIIAIRRIENAAKNIQADAEAKHAKRNMRKK